MGKIIVNPEDLRNAANQLGSDARTFEDLSKQLMQQADTMGEAWQSADNLAYVEKIHGITTRLNQMVAKLEQDRDTLNQQAQNYENQKNANIANIANLGE